MNAAALSSNSTMYNFVKLVDAARQRNNTAFDTVAPRAKAAPRTQSAQNAANVSAFQEAFKKSKPAPAIATSTGYQLPKVTRTKILGNFFDSYA